VRLNRGAAIAERDGAAAGLAEIDAIAGLDRYTLWHAARAVLLDRLGRTTEAAAAREQALALDANEAVRRHLTQGPAAAPRST